MKSFFKKYLLLVATLFSTQAMALPIDWHGTFGVDSTLIDTFRRIQAESVTSTGDGTQEPALASGNHANSSFQTYLISLQPNIVVNDSATFKGELTTGYGRGGRAGDNSAYDRDNNFANSLYYYNTSDYSNNVTLNQFYMELYSDTATYLIGRHNAHWGLGAVVNSGSNPWDRHVTIRDGLTLKIQLGNFKLEPFFAKAGSAESLTRATKQKEHGLSLLYENKESELSFGAYYSIKENNAFNGTITADVPGTGAAPLGKSDIKTIDIFVKRSWNNFDVALEVPVFSGELGDVYQTGGTTKYKAKAFLLESNYRFNDTWKLTLNAGEISGDSGNTGSYEAMFLHPNYHMANLMFRYNLTAVSDTNQSVFDSYMTNMRFFKISGEYKSEKTTLNAGIIWAVANETAKTGTTSYNHQQNRNFAAAADQADDYGFEIDANYDYHWSNEITLGVNIGYLFTGDYWAFTNNATPNSTENSYLIQFRSIMTF